MNNTPSIRKVFQGVAGRQQMFRLFDRHAQRPNRWDGDAISLYAGEWFEISEAEHDYMFELLPPLWIRGSLFAMREYLTGHVTSVFFALKIDEKIRYFHGYCDLSDNASVEAMRVAIIERESRPVRAMTRNERLEHIWSCTADQYRGFCDDTSPNAPVVTRTIAFFGGQGAGKPKVLEDLTDLEIAAKLPVHLRYLPAQAAA